MAPVRYSPALSAQIAKSESLLRSTLPRSHAPQFLSNLPHPPLHSSAVTEGYGRLRKLPLAALVRSSRGPVVLSSRGPILPNQSELIRTIPNHSELEKFFPPPRPQQKEAAHATNLIGFRWIPTNSLSTRFRSRRSV